MKTYSKISNKNTIGLRLKIIELLMLLHLPIFFLLFFIRISNAYKEEFGILLSISFVFLTIMFFRARYFELDSSGEVISIRSYHPIFKNMERRAEFPKQKLQDYKVEKKPGGAVIKVYLKMLEKKNTSVKYSIQGLSKNNVQKLEKSLEKTKEEYKSYL
ncbi:hypothetical protein [Moheibacter sediminis]|uniref:Uncharacterized protein n=1 Tax=Moheibacter sediminis TaxID=1434700 RepID=A0A1W2BBE0_9FLAO|nr:hypothetical protein [Moheibacter sediminis]SMC70131.1 hypothetical protein SAMN06296427_10625 [Moheibacter sediminis]